MGAFLRATYPIWKVLQFIVIFFNNLYFECYNYFQERHIVPKPESDLLLTPASDLAAGIRDRRIKSLKVVETFIQRLKIVNPILNAVVEDNFKDAVKLAAEVDTYLDGLDKNSEEFKQLPETKPFLGVPFTIKDTFKVRNFHITSGIVACSKNIADSDAIAVSRMRDSGAIHLCITNVPEGALWTESANMLYGRSKNPYDSRRSCGGSSGGEGSIVGAAASVISIGSDIGGSIRIPAAHNGIFGLKPSENVVPNPGQFPVLDTNFRGKMLTPGPICRFAKDIMPMLRVLVGPDVAETKLQLSKPVELKSVKFYTMEGTNSPFGFPLDADMRECVRKTAKHFEKKYSKPVFRLDLAKMHHSIAYYYVSLGDKDAETFGSIITGGKTKFPSLSLEIFKKLSGTSAHTVPALIMLGLEKWSGPSAEDVRWYERKRDKLRDELIALLQDDGILIYPSWATVAPFHASQLSIPFTFPNFTGVFNFLRLPSIIVPCGLDSKGMPLSVQLVTAPFQDRLLIAAAQELEAVFGGWRPPGSHLSSSTPTGGKKLN